MEPYHYIAGAAPLFISMPHVGLHVPAEIRERLSRAAQDLPDTDWHVDRLYGWAQDLDIGFIAATHSRYVIDLNRPPDGAALYDGPTTGLTPTILFDGSNLYRDGAEPDERERQDRLQQYWQPYHQKLATELDAIKQRYGYAILFDAHSIRSRVPLLFNGQLPNFNLGTNDGSSAAPEVAQRAAAVCTAAVGYTTVLNGRFKGGYITRHYGMPAAGVHAIQLELTQCSYMDEAPPFNYREDLAAELRPILRRLLKALLEWRPDN